MRHVAAVPCLKARILVDSCRAQLGLCDGHAVALRGKVEIRFLDDCHEILEINPPHRAKSRELSVGLQVLVAGEIGGCVRSRKIPADSRRDWIYRGTCLSLNLNVLTPAGSICREEGKRNKSGRQDSHHGLSDAA